ncbi:MAG: hypothetical protein ICV64_08180 [Thermoleophilia bacterium]|nr:hypothetical protein [Thermoleophilia bacterium]
MRRSFAVLVAVAAAVLAGCGGEALEPAARATGEAAPASAVAYVSVQADLDSGQWRQVEKLLARFPDGEGALDRLRQPREGVDYERDVEPALGPTVELVWLEEAKDREDVVLLTQAEDDDKLRELLRRDDEPYVMAEVGGWNAVARSQELLDAYRKALAAGRLADDPNYRADTIELPEDALATLYVDAERALAAAGASAPTPSGAGRVLGGAAALEATDEGFRVTSRGRTEGISPEETEVGELLAEIPSGAFLALDFRAPSEQTRADPRLDEFDRYLGVPLSALAKALEGEVAFYARRGVLVPELTLLAAPSDAEAAVARLDEAVASSPLLGGVERRQTTIEGVEATMLDLGRFTVLYGAVDGRVVVTTLPAGIRALREEGDKLVDDDRYRDAVEAAGVEDGENVVMYADLQEALRLLEGLSALGEGGVSPETARDLAPLRSLVAASETTGDAATFKLFLEIDD